MANSSLSTKINYRNARQFVDAIAAENTSFYVFIGRPQPWTPDDEDPPVVDNTLLSEYDAWHDMTSLKRVKQQDTRLGFRRIDWESGKVFDEYTHDEDLIDKDFYAITDEQKVYKCISNNNGVASTIKPIHTTADVQRTADGYRWKYMFTLTDSLLRKFAVGEYLPIDANPTVVANAAKGSIEQLKIVEQGLGYQANSSVDTNTALPVFVWGDGDQVATAQATIVTSGGQVQSVSITSSGSGYPTPPETNIPVMIRQVSTTGAVETSFGVARTNIQGQVSSVSVIIGGSGYVTGSATIVHSSCKGFAETDSAGRIVNVEVANGYSGLNFRKARAVVVASSTTPAVIKPIISPFNGHGFSPERELYARYVLINLRIAYDEGQGDFTIENDFRRIGLVENPYIFGTSTVATADTLSAKRVLSLQNITGAFTEDDEIYGELTGAKGLHVDLFDYNQAAGTGKLRYIQDDEFANDIDFGVETIRSGNNARGEVIEIINPEVELYSGDVLFINNRVAIRRSNDQIETITLVLEY